MNPIAWLQQRWFNTVHGRNLVYNTCWEDPRLDREALRLGADDRVVVITSAGCNALDYLLDNPAEVTAVDVNPRQNALLELKREGIRKLAFEDFFQMFGQGRHPQFNWLYQGHLRAGLSPFAQRYWDRHAGFFSGTGRRPSFYFRGSSGFFAWTVNVYIDRIAKVRREVEAALCAESISEQRDIYHSVLKPAFWNKFLRWAVGRDATLALLGVPREQRLQLERNYPGRVARFIEDSIEAVFCELPLKDNYFWRVYLTGEYAPDCCPEYLKRENFERLKSGLIERLHIQTSTLLEHLQSRTQPVSRFVLLDHMDWLCSKAFPVLETEWNAMLSQATPDARFLWRSGGLQTDYLERVVVQSSTGPAALPSLLSFETDFAQILHRYDRVHTYGSFYIAGLLEPTRELACV
jgi:S-adenosylmethionine-diacylglycerol 3-amino-3-carboxypropyl transferase